MNYFRARAAVKALDEFTELVDHYWQALPANDRGSFWGSQRPESAESWQLRQRIHWALPKTARYVRELGVDTSFYSGSRAAGFLRLDKLAAITRDDSDIPRQDIADLLARCRGAAQQELHGAFRRLVIPVYWPVDVLGFLIRFPFLVLQAARLPWEWENTMAGRLIKVLELLVIIGIAARFGLQLDVVAKVLGR